VEVRHDKGIANHIGPEPCAGIREAPMSKQIGVARAMANHEAGHCSHLHPALCSVRTTTEKRPPAAKPRNSQERIDDSRPATPNGEEADNAV